MAVLTSQVTSTLSKPTGALLVTCIHTLLPTLWNVH